MKTDRRTVLAGSLAAAGLAALPARAAGGVDPAACEAALDAVFAETRPVALAGAVVTREGLAWSGVRGVRRFGGDDPATLDDRWHLGSNTKAMTAAVYARLVEQGRADWDAPLSVVFQGATVDQAWDGVTIRDFMRHRAGVKDADALGMIFYMTARADPRPLPEQRRAIAEHILSAAPTGTPGGYEYANANYILAGAAIEALTGQPWEDVMRAELFGPLGLASAGFGAPAHDIHGGGNAWGHRWAGGQTHTPVDPADPGADNPAALGPAGTAHMTLADYATWLRVFVNDGGGWLKPESVAILSDPGAGQGQPYALGWIAPPAIPWAHGPALMHEGSNTLWHAVAAVAPRRGVALIGLANVSVEAGAANGLMPGLVRALG